ncbi:CdaR family transcriptional regulator [Mycobacterium sp. E802]|uniref:PucR family transcriptional regulator n=1 Tax=Mycobacterium sp. E802 TaxID=1834152 RepID=UPI000A97D4B8|nr:helix-turn-helix domain-containing protein [Mycobacterium sp. E802]
MQTSLVDEAQQLVDRLAAQLRQSVAVDDPDGNLIVVSRHFGDADPYRVRLMLDRRIPREYRDYFNSYTRDATTEPIKIPPNPALSLAARICFPIRDDTEIVAFMWLLDLDKVLPQELIERYCTRLARVLTQRRGREAPSAQPSAALIQKLLAGRRDVLADVDPALQRRRYAVVAHYPCDGQDFDLIRVYRQIAGATTDLGVSLAATTELYGCSVGVFQSESSDGLTRLADWLLDETRRFVVPAAGRSACGVSDFGELSQVRQLFARAGQAAFLCLQLYRAESVLSWAQVQPFALLLNQTAPAAGPTAALAALLRDPDSFAFDTVGAVLCSGRDQSPAEILHVHRTTLHYRLQQIVELTGLDLAVPADRFLAVGVWLGAALNRSPLAQLVASMC